MWKITEPAVQVGGWWHLVSPWFDIDSTEKEGVSLSSREYSELSLACCHSGVNLWDDALSCEERLVPKPGTWNIVSVWLYPSNAYVSCDPSSQCGAFYQLGKGGEERDQGTGEDYLTTILSSLLWIYGILKECKSLTKPNTETGVLPATSNRSSCSTLGHLFLRHRWKEHKETTVRCDPAGEREVPEYWEPKCCQVFLLF